MRHLAIAAAVLACLAGVPLGGGSVFVRPWGTAAGANLTSRASGIACYDETQFARTIRTGLVGARPLRATMPMAVSPAAS